MNQAMAIGGLLAIAVSIALARLTYRHLRVEAVRRARGWRIALLLVGQPLCALLLYFTLLPPTVPTEARTMVVATAGATPARIRAQGAASRVSLPEATALADVERVPDLATALRRHPGTRRVRVVGAGLEARDRDVVRGLALEFVPAALPHGVVEFTAPDRVAAGGAFRVGGRVEGMRGGSVELVDPGRQRVDRMTLPADGRFMLGATTRTPGLAVFKLRLRDARRKLLESLDVPVQVVADAPPRVLVLAGAPSPELKYLRRWAIDAGFPMHTQISVGGGLQLGDAPIALNGASLARFDLVVVDERAWMSLGPGARGALIEAVRGGLGVLLRVTGPLAGNTRSQLRALGFGVEGGGEPIALRLFAANPDRDATRARIGPGSRGAPTTDVPLNPPVLTRRAPRITAADASPLLADATGMPVAMWRAEGRGRIGLWPLNDTYRLVLNGRRDLHGDAWGNAVATLARAEAAARTPVIGPGSRPGERMVLCDVRTDARVVAPDGKAVALLPERVVGGPACAAFWPRRPGWHLLQQQGAEWPFHVRARTDGAGLHASALRDATLRLVSQAAEAPVAATGRRAGPRWPWFVGWLATMAGLWWLERARAGRMLTTEP